MRDGEEMQQQGRYSLESILEDMPGITGGAADAFSTSGAIGSIPAARV